MSAILAAPSRSVSLRGMIIGLVLLIPLFVYFSTARSIVDIWNRSETFTHCYIIVPISLWLAWQQRATLRTLPVTPFWPALLLLLGCGFGWLLADLGDVQIVKQYAFVTMLPLTALALLGTRIARTIVFALLFLIFAVPFGEIFIGPLMDLTANFTVAALRATGIPVLREGNNFSIPTGNWSVVDACSGLRYLIASVTLGTLYAHLSFRSRKRQVAFVLLSIIVPIFANSGRAYMIVMMGHLSGMTMAVGVDHLVYGWMFFGIVMFVLFWAGSYWREDILPARATSVQAAAPAPAPGRAASDAALLATGFAIAVCIGIWPAYAAFLQHGAAQSPAPRLDAPGLAWQSSQPFADWKPAFAPAPAQLQQFYRRDGQQAGLTLLYYRDQRAGTRLISSTNRLVGDRESWHRTGAALHTETVGGRTLDVREETIADPQQKMLVWHWYWIDGKTTRSDYVGKAYQVEEKLLHGSDDGAAVMVYAPYDDNPETARATLRAFLAANLTPVEATLAGARKH